MGPCSRPLCHGWGGARLVRRNVCLWLSRVVLSDSNHPVLSTQPSPGFLSCLAPLQAWSSTRCLSVPVTHCCELVWPSVIIRVVFRFLTSFQLIKLCWSKTHTQKVHMALPRQLNAFWPTNTARYSTCNSRHRCTQYLRSPQASSRPWVPQRHVVL